MNNGLLTLSRSSPERYLEQLRFLCRTDLYFLLAYVLRRKDMRHPRRAQWLIDRCREVEENPNNHLDLWAREHYKSTIITFGLTIRDILSDPEITIGIFSHTRPIAKNFLKQIKLEFEGNDLLKQAFPDVLWAHPSREAPKWSEDEGITVRRKGNPKEPTLSAWGLVDGMPTSAHFRLRIYDDTVTRESVTTPEQITKTTEAWELSDNLGAEGGTQRYIGTRYSLNDTYKTMIERGIPVRKYTATHNARLDGKPVLFAPEYWAHKLKTQSRKTLAAQMMQNPMADADAVFDALWLKSYEVRPRILNVCITCDPSKGKHRKSDSTAIAVVGVSTTDNRYLLDGYCHRMTLSQRWTYLRDLYKKWSATPGVQDISVGYERYGAQADDEYFEERMRIEGVHFTIKELNWVNEGTKGMQGKTDRVERLEPDFRNGRFYLPLAVWKDGRPCTWRVETNPDAELFQTVLYEDYAGPTKLQRETLQAGSPELIARAIKRLDNERHAYDLTARLIEEYSGFPFGEHDDLIDAVSRYYDMDMMPPAVYARQATDPAVFADS